MKSINTSQDIFYDFKTQLSLTSFLNNTFFYLALWNYIFARTILNVNEYSNTLTQDMHNSKDPRLNKTLSFETHYRPKVTNFTYLIFWDFLFFLKKIFNIFQKGVWLMSCVTWNWICTNNLENNQNSRKVCYKKTLHLHWWLCNHFVIFVFFTYIFGR